VYASGKDFKCVNAITPNGIPTASADVGILYGIFFLKLMKGKKRVEKKIYYKKLESKITESFCATQMSGYCPV
jgi:hypothetical protein